MRARFAAHLLCAAAVAGCGGPGVVVVTADHYRALGDTVLTILDSVSAIHSDQPDMGILARLHPATDSILYVEGVVVETFTGDSLHRRVEALHRPVRSMSQRFSERRVTLLDPNNAVITAVEDVNWVDANGPHQFHGLMSIVVSRRGRHWVIRAYRG